MAKENGGVIGVLNTPTSTTASGVWALQDQYEAKRNSNWPLTPFVSPYSARFNSGSSDNLTRTPATTGTSRRIMTFSFWTKRSGFETTNAYRLFSTFYGGGASQFWIRFADSGEGINKISIASYDSGFSLNLITTQVFRDISAWYHFVISFDTTQATSSNRVKMYVNGEQVTSFSTATYPSQNYDLQWNVTQPNQIGGNAVSANEFYNGYFSEIYFIDGQQLTPSSFGASNASGVWYPIPYTGSYGTNGFYLKFGNASSLGTDSSPNGNNFTVNNLTSVDQSTDSTLNNFCTGNPLFKHNNAPTFSNGNLTIVTATSDSTVVGNFGLTTGKWYFETKVGSTATGALIGILGDIESIQNTGNNSGFYAQAFAYYVDGRKVNNNVYSTYGNSYTTGDIISVAFDLTNGKIWFGKNGTWQASGDPAAGTNAAFTTLSSTVTYFPAFGDASGGSTSTFDCNFGSPPYSANSYADGNGYGNFSYAVPSGYYALCTANLNTYG